MRWNPLYLKANKNHFKIIEIKNKNKKNQIMANIKNFIKSKKTKKNKESRISIVKVLLLYKQRIKQLKKK